jgi:lipopolysaccharide/colanic/teichoic acid biosynthesis glycosyltransferase
VFYVRNRTLLLDLKIMLATVGTVLTAKGTF